MSEPSEDIFGEHENQVLVGGETEPNQLFLECHKNPGHSDFTPVQTFGVDDLPDGYHDNDLLELIKAVAELTVRVDVPVTSPDRPEFWPDTTVPYPSFSQKKGKTLRSGSGRIRVVTYFDKGYNNFDGKHKRNLQCCMCRKCLVSEAPSTTWWEAEMVTAANVVFDEIEARETSCQLFYDCWNCPVVILDKAVLDSADIMEDKSILIFVSCNKELMEKLEKMVDSYDKLLWKVHEKFKGIRDVDKLAFVVSHPHGGPKQVSTGHWVDIRQVGLYKFKNRFTYTTATCPGSAGAYVYILGYSWGGRYWTQHVHSGFLRSGLGCSGVGDVL